MDANAKKTALRMIPYGLYILTAENKEGKVAAATVLTIVPTILLFSFVQSRLVAGLTAGAVKGE